MSDAQADLPSTPSKPDPDAEVQLDATEEDPDLDAKSAQEGEVRRAPSGEDDVPTDGSEPLNPA